LCINFSASPSLSLSPPKTDKGFPFLDVKNEIFLEYLIDLVTLATLKVGGEDMTQHEDVQESLIAARVAIEKIRTLDQKFQYQIDKFVRAATAGAGQAGSYLQFRPHPEQMISTLEETGLSSRMYLHVEAPSLSHISAALYLYLCVWEIELRPLPGCLHRCVAGEKRDVSSL